MTCTEQKFLKDVAAHEMIVLRDDGVSRHVRFERPSTKCMHFDLITWPGYLCYTGDMGCYVFRRLKDMFEFFRTDREDRHLKDGLTLAINLGYWAEKLQATDRADGVKKYDPAKFRAIVEDRVASHIADEELSADEAARLREEIESEVLSHDESEQDAHVAARDFECGGFELSDFWEADLTAYTYRFIWCCYALAWGIQKYDEAKGGAA